MTGPRVTADDLAALRRAAEAATPGGWAYCGFDDRCEVFARPDGPLVATTAPESDDAAFIVAANPATVLALLDEIDRLRSANEGFAKVVEILQSEREEIFDEIKRDLAAAQTQLAELTPSPDDATAIITELRELWQRTLERECNLASAVADVVWKATQFGETDDGDTYAYIVPKGAMHRLVGVAQQNGAHVPVSFRAALADGPAPETTP